MKRKYVITEGSLPKVLSDLFDETPLTQKEISEKSYLNYSTLGAYTNGRSFPTLRCLLYLLDALGKTLIVVDKEEAPTVAHGWWIHDYNNLYGCSECGERETMSPNKLKNYCPNCGAKMEGSGNA